VLFLPFYREQWHYNIIKLRFTSTLKQLRLKLVLKYNWVLNDSRIVLCHYSKV